MSVPVSFTADSIFICIPNGNGNLRQENIYHICSMINFPLLLWYYVNDDINQIYVYSNARKYLGKIFAELMMTF
jgi:hypothetical protein